MIRVITFGTFDLFHVGHLNLLARAKQLGDHLIVGVSTDRLNQSKKGHPPVFNEADRREIVQAIRYVDETFLEESLELKLHYIQQFQADILVMGNDWEGKFDYCKSVCQVRYVPRTEGISTTEIKSGIKDYL
jgi:glycerol-3-phosphate cytidylyltransferase